MTLQVRRFFQAFLVTTLVLVATRVGAQSWIPIGPPGGDVRSLASDPKDPRRVYLGTSQGTLYRSDDGGQNWQRLSPGLPLSGCSLDDIVVDKRGVVLVGYWDVQGTGGGVARSADGGLTFATLTGIQGRSVRALAVAPSNPSVIAAGTLSGVFLSRDGGRKWRRITPEGDPDVRNVGSLAFDPADPHVLYAGTWHLAWKTKDGGVTWSPMHNGMIDDSDVMTLTVDHWNPETVYATACTGIYFSTDGGMQWTKLQGIPDLSRRTRAFSLSNDDMNLLLAGTTEGLWISEDRGGSWRQATPGGLVVNAVLLQPGGTIVLGTEGVGVIRSADLGRTWITSNTGFSDRFVSRILFDTEDSRVLVAVWGEPRYGGVFSSADARGPWRRLGKGLEGRQVLSLAVLNHTTFAGTDDGIFMRSPKAKVWSRVPTSIQGKEVHPRVTDLLTMPPGRLLAATSSGVLRSPDGGRNWLRSEMETDVEVSDLAVSPRDLNLVVAATRSGFFRSHDAGVTWSPVANGPDGLVPHALAFMPSNGRDLFATSSGGLFRSDDQGSTWRRVGGGIPHSDLTGIAIHPDCRTIYVSDFTWGGIFRSVDSGLTWERMPTDGLASDCVWTLGLDPAAPERLVIASSAGGLHLLAPTSVAAGTAASE